MENSGGEDTVMSIKYYRAGLKAYKNNRAFVKDEVYESMDDFCKRTLSQGYRLIPIFITFPLYPRTYLNPFYWSAREIFLGLIKFDKNYINVGYLRLKFITKGLGKYLSTL